MLILIIKRLLLWDPIFPKIKTGLFFWISYSLKLWNNMLFIASLLTLISMGLEDHTWSFLFSSSDIFSWQTKPLDITRLNKDITNAGNNFLKYQYLNILPSWKAHTNDRSVLATNQIFSLLTLLFKIKNFLSVNVTDLNLV